MFNRQVQFIFVSTLWILLIHGTVGCSTALNFPKNPDFTAYGDSIFSPRPLKLGETVRMDPLDLSICFIDVISENYTMNNKTTVQNLKVILSITHDKTEKLVEVITPSNRIECSYCDCSPIPLLPSRFVVCVSRLRKIDGTSEILVNINEKLDL